MSDKELEKSVYVNMTFKVDNAGSAMVLLGRITEMINKLTCSATIEKFSIEDSAKHNDLTSPVYRSPFEPPTEIHCVRKIVDTSRGPSDIPGTDVTAESINASKDADSDPMLDAAIPMEDIEAYRSHNFEQDAGSYEAGSPMSVMFLQYVKNLYAVSNSSSAADKLFSKELVSKLEGLIADPSDNRTILERLNQEINTELAIKRIQRTEAGDDFNPIAVLITDERWDTDNGSYPIGSAVSLGFIKSAKVRYARSRSQAAAIKLFTEEFTNSLAKLIAEPRDDRLIRDRIHDHIYAAEFDVFPLSGGV